MCPQLQGLYLYPIEVADSVKYGTLHSRSTGAREDDATLLTVQETATLLCDSCLLLYSNCQ